MEEDRLAIAFKNHKLEVKISSGILNNNVLTIEAHNLIFTPRAIEQQFDDGKEFINFGYLGVRRDLIEWYRITEVE